MFRRANGIPIDRKVSPDFNNLPTESVSFVRGRRKSTETSEEKNMKLAPPTLIVVVVVKKKVVFFLFLFLMLEFSIRGGKKKRNIRIRDDVASHTDTDC